MHMANGIANSVGIRIRKTAHGYESLPTLENLTVKPLNALRRNIDLVYCCCLSPAKFTLPVSTHVRHKLCSLYLFLLDCSGGKAQQRKSTNDFRQENGGGALWKRSVIKIVGMVWYGSR
jgi:hypothetical protein